MNFQFKMSHAGEYALIPVSLALLLVHGFFAMRHALSLRPSSGKPSCAFSLGQQLQRWSQIARAWSRYRSTHSGSGDAGEADGMAMLVADAVQQRRKLFMREASGIVLKVGSAILVFVIICTAMGAELGLPWPQFLVVLSCHLFFLIHHYCPWEPGLATLRLFFGTCVVVSGLSTIARSYDLFFLSYCRFALFTPMRLAGSIFLMDTSFAFLMNFASSAMFGVALHLVAETHAFSVPRAQILVADAVSTLIICAVASLVQTGMTASCRHAVELKASRLESQATAKVLNATCDAVVQLDERLCVAIQDTRLAALLLHTRGRILAGSDFLQYLYGDDEHRSFREWLEAPPDRSDEQVGLQAKLRDINGSPIDVEMFRVPFETITGASHNFVGIREKSTEEHVVEAASGNQGTDRAPSLRDMAGLGNLSSSESSCASSSLYSPVLASASHEVHEIDGCPVFKFDGATFKILGFSPGLTIGTHQPPRRGRVLLDELPRCDMNTRFILSFVENAKTLLRHARASPDPVEVHYITSMLLSPARSRFRLDLTIKLSGHWPPDADPQDLQQLLCVIGTAKVLSVTRESRVGSAASGHSESAVRPAPLSL